MSKVTVKDNGAKALLARAHKLAAGRVVRVGVLDDAPKREGEGGTGSQSLLEVAAQHEFGAGRIPQRSFIRGTVEAKGAEIADLQVSLAGRVLKGKLDPDQALEQLGAKVVGMVQTRIAAGIAPALHPDTIEKKGSSTPLIDTGQLRSSITYRVG
jgi:hypothetical protein